LEKKVEKNKNLVSIGLSPGRKSADAGGLNECGKGKKAGNALMKIPMDNGPNPTKSSKPF